ncbi:polysaccharide export outer membrane protein [Sphingobium indicum UT26S]|uniref:Polysaccharide export outer membrane protein n=3 Tax=Sphingobium TaxID=165695 RepID=D4Z5G7_SPHIU|nr:polysaccharide export outer membrane protein [Sphingobium indicum UT26S]
MSVIVGSGLPSMNKTMMSVRMVGATCLAMALSGCAIMSSSGPSARAVRAERDHMVDDAQIKVIDVTDAVARDIIANTPHSSFVEDLGEGRPIGSVIGQGDVLDIAIWEAPPATLFGSSGSDLRLGSVSSGSLSRGTPLPEQMVDSDGQITIPFVGRVQAAGRTPQQIAQTITSRLVGKAHQPQAIVRLSRNAAANVTVVGEVANSARVPLTSRGERILDVLATAGGVRQPVGKMTVQITRGMKVSALPLETVIRDPRQNVRLEPDDVMTLLYQPYSFTALGAIGKNDEVNFEATGLTLAQALGRIAGLQDARANLKGVFIFRFEDPAALDPAIRTAARTTPDGKVPVIYRINMKEPSSLFIAQSFPIRNKDVLYVSNAPLADIQKFVSVIYSTFLPVATTATTLR